MKYCPKCKANVEGLIDHCDCCGAPLDGQTSFFIWHEFEVAASGDVSNYLRVLFESANSCNLEMIVPYLHAIVFDVFCYPEHMLKEYGIRERMFFFNAKQQLNIKIVLPFESYVLENRTGKQQIVYNSVCANLRKAAKKYEKRVPNIEQFVTEVIQTISDKNSY